MLARSLLLLVVTALSVQAAELPDTIPSKKCRGHKKIFAAFDDGTATPRKIKISSAFYLQAGSIVVHGCKTFKGTNQCRESIDIGLQVQPGYTGELPCNSLLYFNYGLTSEAGGESEYWTNSGNCTLTIDKNDTEKGRLKGTYRVELIEIPAEVGTGEIVGCFSAKRQNF